MGWWETWSTRQTKCGWNNDKKMKFHIPISVSDLLEIVRTEGDESICFSVYGRDESDDVTLDTQCFIAEPVEVTEELEEIEEIFPKFVTENNLVFWFSDQLVQDVVSSALHQDVQATNETLLIALKYYEDHDCFLEISSR